MADRRAGEHGRWRAGPRPADMVPEQVIGGIDRVVGEHGDQFAVLAGPDAHQAAGLLTARPLSVGQQMQPRDYSRSNAPRDRRRSGDSGAVAGHGGGDVRAEGDPG